jgi:hypothetical protein
VPEVEKAHSGHTDRRLEQREQVKAGRSHYDPKRSHPAEPLSGQGVAHPVEDQAPERRQQPAAGRCGPATDRVQSQIDATIADKLSNLLFPVAARIETRLGT